MPGSNSRISPERWTQIKSVVQSALEYNTDGRLAFVSEACGTDEALRTEVESLLSFEDLEEDFIEVSAVEVAAQAISDTDMASIEGRRIGSYKILSELGRGGMGAVYLAARDDENYEKKVAVKVIKRGMDTDAILRRFRNERQILANLEHPGIARLLDGGTTDDGLPYLVMEYIDGLPIDAYCNQHDLSVAERLNLFRLVCTAVEFAHQNLIIHRDIKPSNILVTNDGVPKLLDFGIAKVLDPQAEFATRLTVTELRLMTPEYASPEQVRGEAITTVSDVYSLGVVLYELLCGHSPYRFSSRVQHEIARVVTEQEAERPSQSSHAIATGAAGRYDEKRPVAQSSKCDPKLLRGDLDNIVLMAMRKDPARRYASAAQLSEDIRRHLDGLPVTARPDTFTYRASKFVKRNRVASLAAAVILLTLVVGIVAFAWEAHAAKVAQQRAEAEREIAQRHFDDMRGLTNSFMFEFYDAIQNLPGSTAASELVLQRATEYLDQLAQEAKDDPSLQKQLAESYIRLGEIEGAHLMTSYGDSARAQESFAKAMAICDELVKLDPNNPEYLEEWSRATWRVASSSEAAGDLPAALEKMRARLPVVEKLAQDHPDNLDYGYMVAVSYNTIAHFLWRMGDLPGAMDANRKALEVRQGFYDADPSSARWRRSLAIGYEYMAAVQELMNDLPGALENQSKALKIRDQLAAADPQNTDLQLMVWSSYDDMGDLELKSGNSAAAMSHYRQALATATRLLQADPKSMENKIDVGGALVGIGDVLIKTGQVPEALVDYQKSLSLREEVAKDDPTGIDARSSVAESYVKIGDALARQGKASAALDSLGKGIDLYKDLVAASPSNTEISHSLADAYILAGDSYKKAAGSGPGKGRSEALRPAGESYQHALDILKDLGDRSMAYPADAAKIDETTREIARCCSALPE